MPHLGLAKTIVLQARPALHLEKRKRVFIKKVGCLLKIETTHFPFESVLRCR